MNKVISFSLIAVLGSGLALSGCSKQQSSEKEAVAANDIKTLNIGYQKAALKLIVAKQNHLFEKEFPNVKIEWKEFPAGPQTLEALSVNSIDFGYTGDAPIVFALSAGKQLNYLGYEQASNQAHSILLPTDSGIKSLAELKHKRIALTRGSSAHNFLAEALKKANLSWDDIEPIWLSPSDARAALDKKSIDAWAVWEPYISAAEIDGNAKILFDSKELPPTYGYYLAQPSFVKNHPNDAKKVLTVLNEADVWINSHKTEAAEILAKSTGLDVKIAEQVISKKHDPNPVALLTPEVVQSQQKIADLFYGQKLIPNNIEAQKFVWQPNP
ncbi:sulfonate ABC transporter substrate-binding protein [Acinetobacter sp. ANC 4558]|uniref:aliphatic sulfonate ABC transporter substrate-binding protein n=1 Tax=Acinetobacter sp. ANC 4558 TaxID=1977876 RepID=UPI000A3315D7|nr:aliphatic sulfonate ABC transporter substrate-binding protein [Acinetobacter sp. ANC 4558]OTG88287.1 sulfonate ABC transporter substrate-binding protein [Acinetobacter sp. ANC 4558]